jgi:TBC1 domain family member 15
LCTVNELSNTIELEPILIRAEALFRRFQRLVEAIDKKQNFPKPRKQVTDSSNSGAAPPQHASSSSSQVTAKDNTTTTTSMTTTESRGEQREKIISPELRKLLSRDFEVLPRKVVHKQGDGFTAEGSAGSK